MKTFAQGDLLTHPQGEEGQMTIEPICGPVRQMGAETFAIRFNRVGFDNPKRSSDMWFILTYPGDGTYKKMVQQAELQFPLVNKKGVSQEIEFPAIADHAPGGRR